MVVIVVALAIAFSIVYSWKESWKKSTTAIMDLFSRCVKRVKAWRHADKQPGGMQV
jgi:hypothetical protein